MSQLSTNTTSLQGILETVNNLPNVGGVADNKHEHSYLSVDYFSMSRSLPDGIWNTFIYGNGKYIAGGHLISGGVTGRIAYNNDGTEWHLATFDKVMSTGSVNSIVYGNDKFVAVGSMGYGAYSSDGENWTVISIASNPEISWDHVTYGNGKYVAVSSTGYIAYSDDGITWSTEIQPFGNVFWRGIAFGNGVFVATCFKTGSTSLTAYSIDGVTWTQSSTDFSALYITYTGDKFIASDFGVIYHSIDGNVWTRSSTIASDIDPKIVYANGKYVAVGKLQDREIGFSYISDDLITWTETNINTETGWNHLLYVDRKLIAFSDNGQSILFSKDGVDWSIDYTTFFQGDQDITDDMKKAVGIRYNTDETPTGDTWIDGKPIYRKVVNVGSIANSATKDVDLNMGPMSDVISIDGMGYTTNGVVRPLPFVNPQNTANNISLTVRDYATSPAVRLNAGAEAVLANVVVVVEYTKATE